MLSGSGLALISEKFLAGTHYQIYDGKPEYLKILKQAALDLGYESLLDYLRVKSKPIDFKGLVLYPCTEEIIEAKKDHILMVSENLQLFLFKKNEALNELELSAFPHTKKAYEILVEFQESKNLLIPSHTSASESEICLGLSYYSASGEPCGELWSEIDSEYFFSNNAEAKIYNHAGQKYGFYISRDDKSIKYLEREGALSKSILAEWRSSMREKSILYFLGLQNPVDVYGSYSRRSVFIFSPENKLILHFRTTEIGASHILDYIKMRLDSFLKKHAYEFSELKILLADGDHNAQTYLPSESFSDQRLNSYGFHFIIKNLSENDVSSNCRAYTIESDASDNIQKRLLNFTKNSKKLSLLNPLSIISGLFRYINSPKALMERIKNNLKLLNSNSEHQTILIDLDMESSLERHFQNSPRSILFTDENLKDFKSSNLLLLESKLDYIVNFKNLAYTVRELDFKHITLLVENNINLENSKSKKTTKTPSVHCYIRLPKSFKLEHEFNRVSEDKNFLYEHLNTRELITFRLSKRLFGFNTNHKMTSAYGSRIHPITEENSFHHGIDFQALNKQIIFAPINLRIVNVSSCDRLGIYIIAEALSKQEDKENKKLEPSYLSHCNQSGEKLFVLFAHLSEIIEHELGKIVKEYEPLAKAGNTGLSSAPHLHLETRFAKFWDLYFEAESTDPITVFSPLID